jgi:hypothetical protein
MFLPLIALLFFVDLSTSASDHGLAGTAGAQSADISNPAGGSLFSLLAATPTAPGSDMEAGLGASATLSNSYTVHLPLIYSRYRAAPDVAGVQLFWDHKEEETVVKIARMGARWARIGLPWGGIERENTDPSNYRWPASLEGWLARLSARNIQVILTVLSNPSWAATYSGGPIDLADNSDLAQFMVAVVERYGQPPYNVKHYEFYNEPDNGSEYWAEKDWGYFGYEPEAYVQMLAAVYEPMKTADPEAQIVMGGLAYDWWTTDGGPFVEEFLDGVLQYGGGDYFDVMNFHYYYFAFRGNWEPYGPDIIGKATYIRDKLASYGVYKPLICTEAGMWSDEAHGGSHELQTRYVPQLFTRSMAADLDFTIWFMLVDMGGLGNYEYGLLNPDLSPKPAYDAYSIFARQMAFADYVRTLEPSETGSDQIEAYEFANGQRPGRTIVAWTEDEEEHDMWLTADQVAVVDKFGIQTIIEDGDDGSVDGQVQVTIGPNPVYLHLSN